MTLEAQYEIRKKRPVIHDNNDRETSGEVMTNEAGTLDTGHGALYKSYVLLYT